MSKLALAAVVFLYVLISHVLIPEFNNGQDFLLFTKWNMYASGTSAKVITDISWDAGKTYFFRDHRVAAKTRDIDIHSLFYLMNVGKNDNIRKQYKDKLLELCHCDSLQLYKIQSSWFEHIVEKRPGIIVSSEEL